MMLALSDLASQGARPRQERHAQIQRDRAIPHVVCPLVQRRGDHQRGRNQHGIERAVGGDRLLHEI